MYHSVIIHVDDKFINTWDDWRLIPSSAPVIAPALERTKFVTVGGRDGTLDYSQSLTHKPVFDVRTGKLEFYVENDFWDCWETAYTTIQEALQGKRVELALEDNPTHYYEGLLWVNQWKSSKGHSTITLDYNLQPAMKSRPVTEVTLNQYRANLLIGGSFVLQVGVAPANSFYRKVTVKVDPQGIVELDDAGNITGIQNGTAVITVSCGGCTASCTVNVRERGIYAVENTLTNCVTSNTAQSAAEGDSYTATLSARDDWVLTSVSVRMGGKDITASAVTFDAERKTASIRIDSVTGDLEITAEADEGTFYEVVYQLTGVPNNSFPSKVREGDTLDITLAPSSSEMLLYYWRVVLSETTDVTNTAAAYQENGSVRIRLKATGKIAITAMAEASAPLSACSWELIARVSQSGMASKWFQVGDKKVITLRGTVAGTTVNTTLYAVILGIGHNPTYEKEAGIHFGIGFRNGNLTSVGKFAMNTTSSASGGWKSSNMRTTILGSTGDKNSPTAGTFLSLLPQEVRNVMKVCTKYTYIPSSVTATSDLLWLMSEYELMGSITYGSTEEQTYQKQYDYFKAGNSKICYDTSAKALSQWTRTKDASYDEYFIGCNMSGSIIRYSPRGAYGIIVCFGV